jgi:hypothetical protein
LVGFPDLITGASVVQLIKQTVTITLATASDCHVFLDTLDNTEILYPNQNYIGSGGAVAPDHFKMTNTALTYPSYRGGLIVRHGAVGSPLYNSNATNSLGLPEKYLADGPVRVLAKGFEIHNVTPKLTVGGSIAVYRDPGTVPYGKTIPSTLMNNSTPTTNSGTYRGMVLSTPPSTLQQVMLLPGTQQWRAEDGCYVVAVMSAQTNNPTDEHMTVLRAVDADPVQAGNTMLNAVNGPTIPTPTDNKHGHLVSPFFLCGAYLTGLPAGTMLTVNVNYLIERFVDYNSELITLANPSPYYDPVALELYSKTAMRLPMGVKVGENADGDWIKTVADALQTFGVPGMPFVKGAVDLWNKVGGSTNADARSGTQGDYQNTNRKARQQKVPRALPVTVYNYGRNNDNGRQFIQQKAQKAKKKKAVAKK